MSPFIPPAAARPVASAGGLTQARPGCVPHIAFHSTGGREGGAVGGSPKTTRDPAVFLMSPFIPPAAPRPAASAGGPAPAPPRPGPPLPLLSPPPPRGPPGARGPRAAAP